jgi:tetratricopeptide (TPR) repeat protein
MALLDEFVLYKLIDTRRYLYEMAEHKTALHVLNIAFELCPDKTTPLYTHLLNTSASCHFELNNLEKEKPITLECLRLREMQFTPGDLAAEEELANALNNSGVSEATYGNLAASLVLYEKAEEIRVRLGEPAIVPLAVTHMCIGRTYFLQGDYPKACERYELARTIFLDKFGKSGHFMGQ